MRHAYRTDRESPVESKRVRRYTTVLVLLAVALHAAAATAEEDAKPNRPLILVPLPDAPSWQDMALLAAVPSASIANDGKPAVIALPESGQVGRETHDYLRRYRPTIAYMLGGPTKASPAPPCSWKALSADSAMSAGCVLARTFWESSETVVLCGEDDYRSALVASTLAARLESPLLFCTKTTLPAGTATEMERLGASRVITVGLAGKVSKAIKKRIPAVTRLADAKAVLTWMRKKELDVDYIAAVNPRDRSETIIKKLSLAGVLLAAGRQGMVVPLAYNGIWKQGFTGEACEKDLPEGVTLTRLSV